MDIYDINGIIGEALRSHIDISPSDRKEWRMFCCALKVLGFDESTFVALSSGAERDSRQAWIAERSPSRYKSESSAKGMIVELAKGAGMDVKQFLLSPYQDNRNKYDRRPTAPRVTPPPAKPQPPTEPKPEAVYITPQQLEAAHAHANETSLYKYLCREFDRPEVDRVFGLYRIGGAKYINQQGGRAAAFPYIGIDGRCVDCKIFHINPEDGSRKTAPPLATWIDKKGEPQALQSSFALFELRKSDRRADWCNFGDHLLTARPSDPIGIVESEKTALILSLTYPKIIWIAVGSKQNLTPKRFAPYRGRKVTIYPDRDGYNDKPRKDGRGIEKGWRTIARGLAAEGFALSIDTTTERHYPEVLGVDEQGEPIYCKKDLADLVLDYLHGVPPTPEPAKGVTISDTPEALTNKQQAEAAFEDMKKRYPQLAKLAELLQLEAISIEPLKPIEDDTK